MLAPEKIYTVTTRTFAHMLDGVLGEHGCDALFGYPELVEVSRPRITLDIWSCFAGAAVISGCLWAFHDFDVSARTTLSSYTPEEVAMGTNAMHLGYLVQAMRTTFGQNFYERSINLGWFQNADRMNMIVYPDGSLYYGYGEFRIR